MFADILKKLRAEKHISQGKLAEAIGVSAGNVSTWESGESKPGYTALCALARYFGVTSDYLLELSPKKMGTAEKANSSYGGGIAEQGMSCNGTPLDNEETDLIAMYRLLPDYRKEDAFDIICTLYQKHVERKKESIYWTYKEDRDAKSGPAESHKAQDGTA